MVAPDSVDHDPAPGQGSGPAGYQELFTRTSHGGPRSHHRGRAPDSNRRDVALAYTATGPPDGELLGQSPTGKRVSFRGVQIGRFENGKLVERWGSSAKLGMLSQLGLAL